MINNRQGGRRRGRSGQRPQGMPGNSGGGNARDNRQRGNAAQLLEKYKSMARDAQLAGDRVQTEYFLQYAEHYFRILEDSRSRFEESQQQRRGRGRDDEDEDDGEEMMVDADNDGDDEGDDEPRQQAPRRDRAPNRNQEQRGERSARPDRGPEERGERNDRPRRERARFDNENEGDERLPAGILPPAIAIDEGEEQSASAPRRRTRKPREDSEGIAPAA